MFPGSSLTENSVRFLFNLSNDLPSSATVLKSYYLTRVRKLTLNGSIGLPQASTKASKRCSLCSISFVGEEPSYRIQPERKQNKFIKKLLLKNLKRKGNDVTHNKLIIKCGICQKKTREKLPKPKKKLILVEPSTPIFTPRRKKKKKRDLYIGLNKEAVLSISPHSKAYTFNNCSIPANSSINKLEGKTLSVQNKNDNVLPKFNHKKKNKKALQNLKNILNNDRKSQGTNKLKQFLTSI